MTALRRGGQQDGLEGVELHGLQVERKHTLRRLGRVMQQGQRFLLCMLPQREREAMNGESQ